MVLTVIESLDTDAVRPAAELPLPDVYTPIGATVSTNFNNCDLAVPGSPNIKILMSPLRHKPSGILFLEPPNNKHAIAFLMSIAPKILGAILFAILSYKFESAAKRLNKSSSSDVMHDCTPKSDILI